MSGSPFNNNPGSNLFVDWGARIIYVPRDYMLLLQSSPTEIRELDTTQFHFDLRDLEDNVAGIPFPDTHRYIGPVTVGGVALAQVIEIINDYTITFEDGQYAVNLAGSNNNISDRTNVNQVSIRSSNSAGLTYSKQIEDSTFTDSRIWIDTFAGTFSAQYPAGTPGTPVASFDFAEIIQIARTLPKRAHIKGTVALNNTYDIIGWNFRGEHHHSATFDFGGVVGSPVGYGGGSPIVHGALPGIGTTIADCFVQGVQGFGPCVFIGCEFRDFSNFEGEIYDSELSGTIFLCKETVGNDPQHDIVNCFSGVSGTNTPVIDCNNHFNLDLSIRNYTGGLKLRNIDDPTSVVSVDLVSGNLILEESIVAGTIVVRGTGTLYDRTGPGCNVVSNGLVRASGRSFGGM